MSAAPSPCSSEQEAWDLPNDASLSAWLLLLITAGAVAGSAFYEKRIWCRYLCPVGGMNGAMAKLSMTEVRGRTGVCSGSCTTYGCLKVGWNAFIQVANVGLKPGALPSCWGGGTIRTGCAAHSGWPSWLYTTRLRC